MNKENMLKVRLRVERSPSFCMEEFFAYEGSRDGYGDVIPHEKFLDGAIEGRKHNPCGTAACIAGEAALLAVAEGKINPKDGCVYDIAKRYLGLEGKEASWLFLGQFSEVVLEEVTKEEALEAIDHMITGDWG